MFCNVHAGVVKRSKGRSAVAAAAYRSGEKLHDERTGKTHDYSRKTGIEGGEIYAPAGSAWAKDRGAMWNAVEASERRKDAQLAKDLLLTHPQDSTPEQRRRVTARFAEKHFVSKGYVVDAAHHLPHAEEGKENPHTHLLIPFRRADESGFSGPKNVGKQVEGSFDNPQTLKAWQTDFKRLWNEEMATAGKDIRFEFARDRGFTYQPKRGPAWHALRREARDFIYNPKNPMSLRRMHSDIQEKYFEIVWGREHAWEGYDPDKDMGRGW